MRQWADQHGVTIRYHAVPPKSERRWIGVVKADDAWSDHCLLMNGRDALFDPASMLPGEKMLYQDAEPDYGITIERW
jgi:hypothetical protein